MSRFVREQKIAVVVMPCLFVVLFFYVSHLVDIFCTGLLYDCLPKSEAVYFYFIFRISKFLFYFFRTFTFYVLTRFSQQLAVKVRCGNWSISLTSFLIKSDRSISLKIT